MANRFWRGGTGTWDSSTTTNWSTATGGAGGASAPTAADDAIFDANSGGGTITVAATALCQSLDSTNAAACTMAFSTTGKIAIGSASGGKLAIGANVTITGAGATSALSFVSTSTNGGVGWPITTNGKTMPVITFNGAGGRWQLQDNLTVTASGTGQTTLTAGTLDLNAKNVNGWGFTLNGGTLIGAGSTVTLTSTATAWNHTSGTITSSPASIVCSGAAATFAGLSKTYTAVTLSGTGTQTITGNNTFGTLTRSGTGKTLILPANGTQTITTSFVCTGASGLLNVINSSVAATASTILNNTGAPINCDFLSLQDSTVSLTGSQMGGGHNTTYGSNVNNWVHGVANAKSQTAAFTNAGSVARAIAYPQSSALTSSAAVVREPIAVVRGVLGTLTSTAMIPWTFARTLVGVGTSSGVTAKSTGKPFAGELPPAGAMTRVLALGRFFTGALTSSGNAQRTLSLGRQLTGALTSAGALPWLFSRLLPGPRASYAGSLLTNLTGYWQFEDGSGSTAADSSGSGHTATWQGTLGSQWGQGYSGGSGSFDGTDNYLTTALGWGAPFTIACWFETSTTSGDQGLFGTAACWDGFITHPDGISAHISGGSLTVDLAGRTVIATTPFSAVNAWTHFAFSLDGSSNYALYLNGRLVASGSVSLPGPIGCTLNIGGQPGNGGHYGATALSGMIDEASFWARILSAAEVASIYTSNAPSLATAGTVTTSHGRSVSVAGALTFVGALPWSAVRILAGVLTSAGGLLWKEARTFAASEAPAGSHTATVTRLLAAALTSAGSLPWSIVRKLAAAATSSGALSTNHSYEEALAGALTFAGNLPWSVARGLAAALTSSGTVSRANARIVKGVQFLSGLLPWQAGKGLPAGGSLAGNLGRAHAGFRVLTGALTSIGDFTHIIPFLRTVSAALTFAGDVHAARGFRLSGVLSTTGFLTRNMHLARTLSSALGFKAFWRWLGKAPAVTTTLNVRRVSYVIEPDPGAHTVVITTPSGALEVYDWPQSPAILRRGFVQRRGSDAYICTFATEESYDDGPYLGSISAEGMVRQDFQVTTDSDAEINLLP